MQSVKSLPNRHPPSASLPLYRIRSIYLLAALLICGVVLAKSPFLALVSVVPASLLGMVVLQVLIERALRAELTGELKEAQGVGEELARQIEIQERNAQLTREIGQFLCSKTRTEEVVSSVVHILEEKLDFDRGMVLLADEETSKLRIQGVYGFDSDRVGGFKEIAFSLTNPRSRNPFVVAFRRKMPVLVESIGEILEELAHPFRSLITALGIESFIACPIVLEGRVIGVLGVDNRSGRPLQHDDVNLLFGIAPVIAISIHNAQLLEARQAQFDSTLHVLAESIDARDYLTAGHSKKVAEYAEGIAREMGLSDDFRRMLRTAALLHDYGKIAIPDNILKKEGPLSEEERAIINTHPARTKQILEKIAFQGIFREIPQIVLSHHERWDGTGYPNALQGEQIPLAARIIAVADYYEAITAKRHYREPMFFEEALGILESESGGHFDPEVLEAFLSHLRTSRASEMAEEAREHQVRVPRSAYRTEISAKVDRRIFAGVSVDISCGGLYFATDDVLDISPDTEVYVTFELPQERRLTQVRGKVAWVNSGYPRPAERLPEGFGVAFEEVGDEVRQVIENYMGEAPEASIRQPAVASS